MEAHDFRTFKSFAATSQLNGGDHWRLSCFENGLRIFEEDPNVAAESQQLSSSKCSSSSCKGISLIFSRPELVFKLVMDLESTRRQWDLTFDHGYVVESIDEHTDVIHLSLRKQCSTQDFCLSRCWNRDPDGSYVIVYSSVEHPMCQRTRGMSRGVMFGGWIISPFSSASALNVGKPGSITPEWSSACLVTKVVKLQHNLWLEWFFRSGRISLPQRIVIAQVAGLRELCDHTSELREIEKKGVDIPSSKISISACVDKEGVEDKYFEASSEVAVSDLLIQYMATDTTEPHGQASLYAGDVCNTRSPKLINIGSLTKGKWPFEAGLKSTNCWCAPDGDNFRVRGSNYLHDRKKVPAGQPFAELVAVDWFVDYQRIDNICSRPSGTCQHSLLKNDYHESFVFAVNIQVPGPRHFSIVYYYRLRAPLDKSSLFSRFVHGDDAFRNSRLKLIPSVALGPWVVQRAVGTKPLIVGRALKVVYHSRPNYLEVDIDIGSSTVANNVVRFVLGYVRTLVVDMCFLIEGKSDGELPERLIGTSRIAHLEPDAAVPPPPVV